MTRELKGELEGGHFLRLEEDSQKFILNSVKIGIIKIQKRKKYNKLMLCKKIRKIKYMLAENEICHLYNICDF